MNTITPLGDNRRADRMSTGEDASTGKASDTTVTYACRKTADGLDKAAERYRQLAANEDRALAFMEFIYSIPDPIARTAAFEAAGFPRDVAVGLSWRCQQGMERFDSKGFANIGIKFAKGQYGPTIKDIQNTFRNTAEELDKTALAFRQFASMDPAQREFVSQVVDGTLLAGTVSVDIAGVASSLKTSSDALIGKTAIIGGAITLLGMAKNACEWSLAKKLANLPGSNLTALAGRYLDERNNFGKSLTQLMLLGIPGASTFVEVMNAVAKGVNAPRLDDWSMADMLEAATR